MTAANPVENLTTATSIDSMAQVPQTTLRYLYYDVLKVQPYRDPNRTYSDLVSTLQKYAGITVKGTQEYIYDNGRPELLLYLGGVLPVSFRGTLYHFPILIWIPYAYPHEAPLLYVDPNDDMVVNPGQHVAPDGKIYHPYLAHWRDAWDRSNVVDFLSILSDVFAKEPPVRSKPRQSRPQHHPPPPPRPPLPHEAQSSPQQPVPPSPHRQGGPPPPPPKGPAAVDGRAQSPQQPRPGRYDAPLPLPSADSSPRPTSIYQQQRPQPMLQPRPTSQYEPQRQSSLRQPHPPQQWQQPSQPQPHPSHPPSQPYLPQNAYSSPAPHGQQQPGPHRPHQQQYAQHPTQSQQPQPPKQPPPDLLDSPFDLTLPATNQSNLPAPPIPRNPEKDALLTHLSGAVTSTLHNLVAQNHAKLAPLQSQQSALQQTHSTLTTELSHLQALHSTLTANLTALQTSLASADRTIADASSRASKGDIPAVDGMLITPHVVSTQLYNVVAEERGLEAAILALQEAFTRGRVGSEVWSKKTRELSREEFKRRWVGRKIGRGMGLEGS